VTVSGLLLQRSDLNMGAHAPLVVVVGLALLAALLTLGTSWTSWPTTTHFDTDAGEINWLASLLSVRGNIAVIASAIRHRRARRRALSRSPCYAVTAARSAASRGPHPARCVSI
jgi:hypothetical protein